MRTKLFFGIASMLLLTSCMESYVEIHHELTTDGQTFTAVIEEHSTRTSLSSYTDDNGCYSLTWNAGDAISITDGLSTAVFTTDEEYTSAAEFTRTSGTICNTANEYEAFYPSTITSTNMILPAEQNYVDNNISNFPMRAVSNNKNLAFKNLCGIIRFSLKSEEIGQIAVSSIALSADKGMSGEFTVDESNAAVVTGTSGVVLNCAEPEMLYTTIDTDFNIAVPEGEYTPLQVKICDSEGKEINLVSESAIKVKRSEITRITLTLAKSSFDTSLETIPITDADVDFTER